MNQDNLRGSIEKYLSETYTEEIEIVSIKSNTNEGNLGKNAGSTVYVSSSQIGKHEAILRIDHSGNSVKITEDTYPQEKLLVSIERQIEEASSLNCSVYLRLMGNIPAASLVGNSVESEKEIDKILENKEFQLAVYLHASDYQDQKEKYEMYNLEMMKLLLDNGIREAEMYFVFYKEDSKLADVTLSPQFLIESQLIDAKNLVARWKNTHNVKWYNMVKDHPEKIMKYGKILKEY